MRLPLPFRTPTPLSPHDRELENVKKNVKDVTENVKRKAREERVMEKRGQIKRASPFIRQRGRSIQRHKPKPSTRKPTPNPKARTAARASEWAASGWIRAPVLISGYDRGETV